MTGQESLVRRVARRWRGRTVVAAAGATVLAAGLVTAAPAQAAPAPSITLTFPATISNAGDPASFSITVTNPAGGDLLNGDLLQLILNVPAPLDCAGDGVIVITPVDGKVAPPLANYQKTHGRSGSICDFQAFDSTTMIVGPATFYLPKPGATATYDYTIQVYGSGGVGMPATGAIDARVEIDTVDGGGNVTGVLASATGTPDVGNAHAPSFNPPPTQARVGEDYSYQVVKDQGLPVTDPLGGYRAVGYANPVNSNSTPITRFPALAVTVGTGASTVTHHYISLNDTDYSPPSQTGFFFDTTTGVLVYGTLTGTSSNAPTSNTFTPSAPTQVILIPKYTFAIVANNGKGGAPVGGTPAAPPTPALSYHDVASPPLVPTPLFTDVTATNPFRNDIYTLALAGIVTGYANGTFGITNPVSRQAFAAFAVRLLNLARPSTALAQGACDATHPSAFRDVPAGSPFCRQIQGLVAIGVINGYADGAFHPAAAISRQAIAALLYRLFVVAGGQTVQGDLPGAVTGFSDVPASNQFSGDIAWLISEQITTGYDGGTLFKPTAPTSRQAVAAFLVRWGGIHDLFSAG